MLMTTKKLACLLVVAFALSALTGCNTVQGLGKDIERAGEEIQDGAD